MLPPDLLTAAEPAPCSRFRAALSVSPFTETVLKTVALTDGARTAKTVRDVQRLFNRHGATELYQRIATRKRSPQDDAEHGWELALERARLAADLNMPFNPELGLFANYGDAASYQEPPDFTDYPGIRLPGPWTSLKLEQMLPALREYGVLVARQIRGTRARVDVWDLGNEIEVGVAGVAIRPTFESPLYQPPDAVDPEIGRMSTRQLYGMPENERVAWCRAHLWPHTARMLNAVADGIRSVDSSARFSTHTSSFAQRSSTMLVGFWETMEDHGYLPEELGVSFWGMAGWTNFGPADTFGWLRELATDLKRKFDRPLFVSEFGFPSEHMPPPWNWNDAQKGYEQSEQGQYTFTRDVIAWGASTGLLSGIRPWAADFCTSPGWAPLSWFRLEGSTASAKPALHAFRDALKSSASCVSRR